IDYLWGGVFVELMHADPHTGLTIYFSLSGGEARRAALKAAATARLPAKDLKLFEAVERVTRAQRRRRNSFAHGLWGTSSRLPDAYLLTDPEVLSESVVKDALVKRAGKRPSYNPTTSLDTSRMMVYSRAALLEAWQDAYDACATVFTLVQCLEANRGGSLGVRPRRRLLNRPQVAAALRQLNRKPNPKAQPSPPLRSRKKKR
ncbi:MAG TPA: hypothetical protein VKY24_09580, partial [Reyranella sp.]|nr:hypothetical protein [Reyranella sp.]